MATYEVFVTYTVDDSFYVEADSPEEAMELAEQDDSLSNILPYSQLGGYTMSWDDINIYDAILEEE